MHVYIYLEEKSFLLSENEQVEILLRLFFSLVMSLDPYSEHIHSEADPNAWLSTLRFSHIYPTVSTKY